MEPCQISHAAIHESTDAPKSAPLFPSMLSYHFIARSKHARRKRRREPSSAVWNLAVSVTRPLFLPFLPSFLPKLHFLIVLCHTSSQRQATRALCGPVHKQAAMGQCKSCLRPSVKDDDAIGSAQGCHTIPVKGAKHASSIWWQLVVSELIRIWRCRH